MLKSLYGWTMALAARKTAEVWLAVIAFIESSVFLVTGGVLFLPMALARPASADRFALGWAPRGYGEPIRGFMERRLGLIAAIAAALLIGLYVLVSYSGIAGAVTSC